MSVPIWVIRFDVLVLKNNIPELPDDKKKRFIDEFKLSPYEATILVSDIDTAKYFEEVVAKMGKNKDMKLVLKQSIVCCVQCAEGGEAISGRVLTNKIRTTTHSSKQNID